MIDLLSGAKITFVTVPVWPYVPDGHTVVRGLGSNQDHRPPVLLRLIEDTPVVTWAEEKTGLHVGDVIETVGGEPAADTLSRKLARIPGSTLVWRQQRAVAQLLEGTEGSSITVTVHNDETSDRKVELLRDVRFPRRRMDAPSYQRLSADVGYARLDQLTFSEVSAMLEEFKDTKGIVFDMRGYPRGTAWVLAPRLNVSHARHAASFRRNRVTGQTAESIAFQQRLPETDKWIYEGKAVTLIDDRAVSQAEHTGLFLEAACDTTFVGSHTAGANGDTTNLTLPGGTVVGFTGHDVRHADGRQLQRIGLIPHVQVAPTIRGIREGRDEVLEKAIEVLSQSFSD